ncbi:Ribulose bisphosphate carboxylase, chloroplastic [Symbiodinium microadriaticum]|uniref:Ribulose bisphosphate carboxylase, chloroplastic n=1 Tax=Symbiodinium microadriaticum TaxID=2951 RepID=A0A1Q9DAF0_SYMMI|nr:Ribulose bisphosphate carboxylase, chloroplastic [Symbiodinium microadriaticum]
MLRARLAEELRMASRFTRSGKSAMVGSQVHLAWTWRVRLRQSPLAARAWQLGPRQPQLNLPSPRKCEDEWSAWTCQLEVREGLPLVDSDELNLPGSSDSIANVRVSGINDLAAVGGSGQMGRRTRFILAVSLGVGVRVAALPNWAEGGGLAGFHGGNFKHNQGDGDLACCFDCAAVGEELALASLADGQAVVETQSQVFYEPSAAPMTQDAYADLEFGNDVGYLPGKPSNMAGNCINHPVTVGPDPHQRSATSDGDRCCCFDFAAVGEEEADPDHDLEKVSSQTDDSVAAGCFIPGNAPHLLNSQATDLADYEAFFRATEVASKFSGALINLEQEFSEPAPVFTCLAKTIIEHGSSRMADDGGVACSSGLTCCVNLPRENFFTAQS